MPFYIISYFTFLDKNTFVGGLRPFYLYQLLQEKGYNVELITRYDYDNSELVVKEGPFIKMLKPILRIFPPDSSIAWSIKVFFFLKRRNRKNKFIVFTTVPPNGLGIIGLLCKYFLKNCSWIADYRDLWTNHPLYKPPFTKKYFDPVLEKKFLKKADLIVLNTKWDVDFNKQLFPFITDKVICVRNGFNKIMTNKFSDSCKFIYAGGTTGGQATIAIKKLLEKLNDYGKNYICEFYGEHDIEMENSPHITYKGTLEPDAIPELLTHYKFGFIYLPKGSESGGRVAQKFYDYMGSGVIPICFRSSIEMRRIMNELNVGFTVNDDTELEEINDYLSNAEFNVDINLLEKYSRYNQFELLVSKINK